MGTHPQPPSTTDRVREYADATGSFQASSQLPEPARTATQLMLRTLEEHVRAIQQSILDDEPFTGKGPLTGARLADLIYDAHYLGEYLGIDLDGEIRRTHEQHMDKVKPPVGQQTELF